MIDEAVQLVARLVERQQAILGHDLLPLGRGVKIVQCLFPPCVARFGSACGGIEPAPVGGDHIDALLSCRGHIGQLAGQAILGEDRQNAKIAAVDEALGFTEVAGEGVDVSAEQLADRYRAGIVSQVLDVANGLDARLAGCHQHLDVIEATGDIAAGERHAAGICLEVVEKLGK